MDKKVDAQLVSEYRSGNRMALAKLVRRWHKPFCNKAYWIVNDADLAKDIAQDSWATIISKIHSLKDERSFGSWALRIVYSKSLDELRKNSRKRTREEAYRNEIENKTVTDASNDNQQLKLQILDTIKRLPERQQMVLKLFYVEDYSLKEISDLLNISIGTTKSRLFHARETLKKTLKKENNEK